MIGLKKKQKQSGGVPTVVPLDDCVPNTWNMNSMEPAAYRKLKAWIERSYRESGKLALPVVLRTHPTQPGKWEIIDGYHRWKAVGELKRTEVDCWVYECDDKAAMLLTDALNYLRGDPNPDKYADYLKDLTSRGVDREEIAQFTHVNTEELEELASTYDIKLADPLELSDPSAAADATTETDKKDPDEWIEMKFAVPRSAGEVIEAELARIGSVLTGKNVRARALEFAMVQSAQTPLPDVVPEEHEKKVEKTKAKLSLLAGIKKRRVDGSA